MITASFERLYKAAPVLRRLGERPLSVRAAYDLTKLRRLIAAELDIFHDRRLALIRTHNVTPDSDEAELRPFEAAITDLLRFEVSIPWKPFDLRVLGDGVISSDDLEDLGVGLPDALAVTGDEVVTTTP